MSLKIYGTVLQTQLFVKLKFTSTIINNLDGWLHCSILEDGTTAGVWLSAGWCQTTNNQLDKLEYQMSNLRGTQDERHRL